MSAILIVWRRWGRCSTTAGASRHVDHCGGSDDPDLFVVGPVELVGDPVGVVEGEVESFGFGGE